MFFSCNIFNYSFLIPNIPFPLQVDLLKLTLSLQFLHHLREHIFLDNPDTYDYECFRVLFFYFWKTLIILISGGKKKLSLNFKKNYIEKIYLLFLSLNKQNLYFHNISIPKWHYSLPCQENRLDSSHFKIFLGWNQFKPLLHIRHCRVGSKNQHTVPARTLLVLGGFFSSRRLQVAAAVNLWAQRHLLL